MRPLYDDRERKEMDLLRKAERAAKFQSDNGLTFGQKVMIRFWLGGKLMTGSKYLNLNAAEEKWIAAQNPEVDWDEIGDEWVEKVLRDHSTEIPRMEVAA
jgi:hypothetical protein